MTLIRKKERYYFFKTKKFGIVAAMMLLLSFIPLTDYSFHKETLFEITAADYLQLLNCGGGMFIGFAFNFVLFIIVCAGLVFHSEVKNKTILYEKMNGESIVSSVLQRFEAAGSIAATALIIIVLEFLFFSFKNGYDVEESMVNIVIKYCCMLLSGLQIAFVTSTAAIIFRSGYKAVIFSFVRYLVFGFLWASAITGVNQNIYIQMSVFDPFDCMWTIFESDLIMNNYWIILCVVVMSFLINTGIMIGAAVIVDGKREG